MPMNTENVFIGVDRKSSADRQNVAFGTLRHVALQHDDRYPG